MPVNFLLEETYVYTSLLARKEFQQQLDELIEENQLSWRWNLGSRLIGENQFLIIAQWQWIVFRGPDRKAAYLQGEILQHSDNFFRIKVGVRPNVLAPAIIFGIPLFSLAAWLTGMHHNLDQQAFITYGAGSLTAIVLSIFWSHHAKKSLRETFERHFELQECVK